LDGLDPLRRIRLTGSARTAVIFVVYIPAYVDNNLHANVVGTCQLGTSHCFGRIHVRILQHNYGIQTTQGGGKKNRPRRYWAWCDCPSCPQCSPKGQKHIRGLSTAYCTEQCRCGKGGVSCYRGQCCCLVFAVKKQCMHGCKMRNLA
jgi:hypothetical protein